MAENAFTKCLHSLTFDLLCLAYFVCVSIFSYTPIYFEFSQNVSFYFTLFYIDYDDLATVCESVVNICTAVNPKSAY